MNKWCKKLWRILGRALGSSWWMLLMVLSTFFWVIILCTGWWRENQKIIFSVVTCLNPQTAYSWFTIRKCLSCNQRRKNKSRRNQVAGKPAVNLILCPQWMCPLPSDLLGPQVFLPVSTCRLIPGFCLRSTESCLRIIPPQKPVGLAFRLIFLFYMLKMITF